METRIFFPLSSSPSPTPDLASSSTTLKICSNAPNLFGSESHRQQEASDQINASFGSGQKPTARNDLYLVLPPSSCGNYIGLKWRGQSEGFLQVIEDSVGKNLPEQQLTALRTKIVYSLLGSSVEVKVSPFPTTTTTGNNNEIPKPLVAQEWTKYKLNSFEKPSSSSENSASTPLHILFITSLAKTLEKLSKQVRKEHAQPIDIAVASLIASITTASSSQQQQLPFALVSTNKKRIKTLMEAGKFSWDLEQTDMKVTDVTSRFFVFFSGDQSKNNNTTTSLVRSWCAEPHVAFFSNKDDKRYFDLSSEFIQACASVVVSNSSKISSYPHFLAETFF